MERKESLSVLHQDYSSLLELFSQTPPFCICLGLQHMLIWIYYCCGSHWNRPLWDKGLLMHFGFAHDSFQSTQTYGLTMHNLEAGKIVNTCFALSKTRTQELALGNSALFTILDYTFLFEISCGFINQNHWLFIQHKSREGLNMLHAAWEQNVTSGCVLHVWEMSRRPFKQSNSTVCTVCWTSEEKYLGKKDSF